MFKYDRVLNASTGKRYFISRARLTGDEIDDSPGGSNSYEIELTPEDLETPAISGVTLCVFNNGYTVCLTKDLDPVGSSHKVVENGQEITREELVDAFIEGRTLIVTEKVDRRGVICGREEE